MGGGGAFEKSVVSFLNGSGGGTGINSVSSNSSWSAKSSVKNYSSVTKRGYSSVSMDY